MNKKEYELLNEFYNNLADDESRYIFRKRILYLFTGNLQYLKEMTYEVNSLYHPSKLIRNIKDAPQGIDILLYGAGRALPECIELLKKYNITPIAVSDKKFSTENPCEIQGLPTISPHELFNDKYKEYKIFISNIAFYDEIVADLLTWGIHESRLFLPEFSHRCTNYIHSREYFNPPIYPEKDEVYIDCGMLNGGSVKSFINFCKGNYKKIYGFEPSPNSYKRVLSELKDVERLEVFQKAVYSSERTLHFSKLENETAYDPGGARISEFGEEIIKTTTIDSATTGQKVTFIKMDIEGAELEALKGAEQTILRDNPKLAICMYHKPEDIIEIPLYLYKLHPENKYYLRHHNYVVSGVRYMLDTVLYSIKP